MTTYYLPDLSGQNPDYLQVNMPAYIYQADMKVSFENSPIFVSSLSIALTDGTGRPLVKDTDWIVNDDDIDQTAMSRAFLENNSFTGILVKSITMKSTLALNKPIAMTYQEFYLTIPGRIFDDGRPYEVSPDLIKSLSSGLADVRQQIARVQSPVAPNPITPLLLPFDINSELTSNQITNENIVVNTIVGAKVIRLSQGAYFADSLTLTFNGTPLNAATDYLPIVFSPLTNQSTNKSGIYQYILLNKSLSGTLVVSYHAVGGDVQIDDINAVYESMLGIKNYLNDGIFVTSDTITETPSFRAFNARLGLLEDGMRRLLTGVPTYGDSSSNNATTRPIQAQDSDFHWWTIATLYQVEGSIDIINADQFKGRVYLPDSKISLAFTVDVNIDQTRDQVSFKTDSFIFDPNYELFGDLSVNVPQYPMVRVVWNQASQAFSGACIQFGVPLPTLADRMVVEDLSSAESCWILNRTNEFIVGATTVDPSVPEDNGFLLPDGVSVWSSAAVTSFQEVCLPDYPNGYLVYSGAQVQIDSLVTVASTGSLFNVVLPTSFPINQANTLIVTMLSADSETVYDLEIPMTGLSTTSRVGRVNFCDSALEAMCIMATLSQDGSGIISIALNISEIAPPLITGTISPKTDIVRYIRAKV